MKARKKKKRRMKKRKKKKKGIRSRKRQIHSLSSLLKTMKAAAGLSLVAGAGEPLKRRNKTKTRTRSLQKHLVAVGSYLIRSVEVKLMTKIVIAIVIELHILLFIKFSLP